MNQLLERFVSTLILYRWPLFGIALLLAAAAYFPSRYVRFDRSIENMFAPSDPLLPPYLRLKRDFGGNEVIMAVYQDDELLVEDGRGLKRLADITQRIETVPGIDGVLSLSKINAHLEQLEKTKNLGGVLDLFRRDNAPKQQPILDRKNPLGSRFRELFSGYTHSADGRTAAIVCMLRPHGPDAALNVPRETTIAGLQKIMHDLPGNLAPGFLAGEPVMVSEGFSLLEKDGDKLGTWTLVLMGITVLVLFRSLRWLLVPIVVVYWTLLLTRAVLVLTGGQLSMVSSMLTAIVTVVAVAGVMHIIVEIRELRARGLSQHQALHTVGVLLAGPVLGAVLTDASGFGSLWWASVEPVRDFGTMMVTGSLLVLPAICLLVPALALAFTSNRPVRRSYGEGLLGHWLMLSVDWIRARPKTVAIIASIIALVTSLGALRLEVETDFTRNFRRSSSIVRAYEFVETHLGGAGVWDVIIPAPAVLDANYLVKVRQLQQRLRALEQNDPATGKRLLR